MNLAEAILELADDLEKELPNHFQDPEDQITVKCYIKLMRGMVKMSQPKQETTPPTATIQATHLPQQSQKPKSLLTAPMHEDPWRGEPLPQPRLPVDDDDDYDPRDP